MQALTAKTALIIATVLGSIYGLADAPGSHIAMLVRAGRTTKTLVVKSVSFDHATIGKMRPGGPPPANPTEVTLVLPASAASQATLKPTTKLTKIDLVLYTTNAAGHQRMISQLELGNSVVSDYKLSEDKKTATVKLAVKLAFLSEQVTTANANWVASS